MDLVRPKVARALTEALTQHGSPLGGARPVQLLALAPTTPSVAGVMTPDTLHLDARAHLMHALQLDPTAVRPRVLLFHCELSESRFVAAEQIIAELLRDYPLDPDHWALHAELQLRLAELPRAKESAARALKLDPEHVEARRVATVLDIVLGEQLSGDQASPAQRLAKWLEHNPDTAPLLFTVFQNLVAHHHVAEAARLGHALLGAQPHNVALSNALVDLRILGGPLGAPSLQWRKAGWLGLTLMVFFAIAIYMLLITLDDTLSSLFLVACLVLGAYVWLYPAVMRVWYAD